MDVMLEKELLVISLNARSFAKSARRGGWKPVVVDQFSDSDTVKLAARAYKIDFDLLTKDHRLQQTIGNELNEKIGLIYGSGVDYKFEFIQRLFEDFLVYGNAIEVLRLCYKPRAFFALLGRLGIDYPQTRFTPPKRVVGWLSKEAASEGGCCVSFLERDGSYGASVYYQKFISGPVFSALFLANKRRASIIGFNTQWVSKNHITRPFLFSGLINQAELSSLQKESIASSIQLLVEAIGLKGLNSIDFIPDGDTCKIIELNPRPSASLALYDDDFPRGLIAEHISACMTEMELSDVVIKKIRAIKVIYAPTKITIPPRISWPKWCVDRPFPGTVFFSGQAMCSVTASGASREAVEKKIMERENAISSRFSPK